MFITAINVYLNKIIKIINDYKRIKITRKTPISYYPLR